MARTPVVVVSKEYKLKTPNKTSSFAIDEIAFLIKILFNFLT